MFFPRVAIQNKNTKPRNTLVKHYIVSDVRTALGSRDPPSHSAPKHQRDAQMSHCIGGFRPMTSCAFLFKIGLMSKKG